MNRYDEAIERMVREHAEVVRERIERHTVWEPNTGCLLWTGANVFGYGVVTTTAPRLPVRVHRLVWVLNHGPIPEGIDVLHHCDTPPCVNDAHLFLGTQLDNMRDMIAKDRYPRGERHHNAKLTVEKIGLARGLRLQGFSQHSIAVRLGVSQSTLSNALTGAHWKGVA